jgi:hypothetical protein
MPLVFSARSDRLIVMTADSAVTLDFEDHREYEIDTKAYPFHRVGCVTTWGERTGNRIGEFLGLKQKRNISADTHSVEDLANLVNQYLTEAYRPDESNLDEVGYHVAGFDRAGHARLYHVFWGFDRPKPPEQISPQYQKYDHSNAWFLFNGRNDLAQTVVNPLITQIAVGNDVRFDLATPLGLAQFSEFVARFSAELTREVGPPFFTYLIAPQNRIEMIENRTFCPTRSEDFLKKRSDLGL